jgi:hypothetical protein
MQETSGIEAPLRAAATLPDTHAAPSAPRPPAGNASQSPEGR